MVSAFRPYLKKFKSVDLKLQPHSAVLQASKSAKNLTPNQKNLPSLMVLPKRPPPFNICIYW